MSHLSTAYTSTAKALAELKALKRERYETESGMDAVAEAIDLLSATIEELDYAAKVMDDELDETARAIAERDDLRLRSKMEDLFG